MTHKMRRPCPKCGCPDGNIEQRGNQDCVFCSECSTFQYNAPRTETGREVRSVLSTHESVTAKLRARILARDGFSCICCHSRARELQVGHLLSVKSAHELFRDGWLAKPFTDEEVNSEANLAAMCDACNSGLGGRSIHPRLLAGLLRDELRRQEEAER